MKYAYEDLGDDQFEVLIVLLCQKLLGISVQHFSKGPDGGRDAKFVGTAVLHPSPAAPWEGITIIQAKHTNGYNRKFAETDFYNPKPGTTSILGDELPRIKKLRSESQLDHYMLFANRGLAGGIESAIRRYISKECGIPEPSIYISGVEQLELFFKKFPDIPKLAELDPIDCPLIVSPDDLADVVQALGQNMDEIKSVLDTPPVPRLRYARKNELNNMTHEYASNQLKRYLKETRQIHNFLAAPENIELLRLYESVVEEFQSKIISKRRDYQTFDEVMEYLLNLLFSRDPVLRQRFHKRLTRAVLFYMYWNCDIGRGDDAQTN